MFTFVRVSETCREKLRELRRLRRQPMGTCVEILVERDIKLARRQAARTERELAEAKAG